MRVLARLLTGILAAVFLPLGTAFLVVGSVSDEVRSGRPEDFLAVGAAAAGVGLAFLCAFVILTRRERARRARRTARASAEVLDARLNHGVQLNAKRQLRLSVRFAAAGDVSGSFFWLPSVPIGDRIEVLYDPDEPANFEPVDLTGGTGIMRA